MFFSLASPGCLAVATGGFSDRSWSVSLSSFYIIHSPRSGLMATKDNEYPMCNPNKAKPFTFLNPEATWITLLGPEAA